MRCFRSRVPSPQKSPRLLPIKPAEVMLFYTGADSWAANPACYDEAMRGAES